MGNLTHVSPRKRFRRLEVVGLCFAQQHLIRIHESWSVFCVPSTYYSLSPKGALCTTMITRHIHTCNIALIRVRLALRSAIAAPTI